MSFDNRSSTMDGNGGNPEMQPQSPPLCKNGCGFYGNPMQEGLCSKCHKDKVKRLQPTSSTQTPPVARGPSPPTAPTDETSLLSTSSPSSSSSSSSSSSLASSNVDAVLEASGATELTVESKAAASNVQTSSDQAEEKLTDSSDTASTTSDGAEANAAGKPKKNRCLACNKKVGLTGFGCRCGGLFCSTHRYSDLHNCAFDYKEHAQDQIRKNNPVVVGNKIAKI